jgi:hypothetical protein
MGRKYLRKGEVLRERGGFSQYGLLVVTALGDTEFTHTAN